VGDCGDIVKTPEGLYVCLQTGEVLGFEMLPGSPEEPPIALNPLSYGFIHLSAKRNPNPLKKQSSAPRRVKGYTQVEAKLYKALARLKDIAAVFEVPLPALDDASILLRKVVATHYTGKHPIGDCDLAAMLILASNARGFHVPPGLGEVCEEPGGVTPYLVKYSKLAPRPARGATLKDRIEAEVSRLCALVGLDGEACRMARELAWDTWLYKTRRRLPKGSPSTMAKLAVHAMAKLTGLDMKAVQAKLKIPSSKTQIIYSSLVVEVEA